MCTKAGNNAVITGALASTSTPRNKVNDRHGTRSPTLAGSRTLGREGSIMFSSGGRLRTFLRWSKDNNNSTIMVVVLNGVRLKTAPWRAFELTVEPKQIADKSTSFTHLNISASNYWRCVVCVVDLNCSSSSGVQNDGFSLSEGARRQLLGRMCREGGKRRRRTAPLERSAGHTSRCEESGNGVLGRFHVSVGHLPFFTCSTTAGVKAWVSFSCEWR